MSDLDKLMKKLKDKPKEETEKKEVVEVPKVEDLKDPDEDLEETEKKEVVEVPKVEENEPKEEDEAHRQAIEGEIAVLQNEGVFRRELLFTLKQLVDVHKANTQTLIDIKKLVGGENAKGK